MNGQFQRIIDFLSWGINLIGDLRIHSFSSNACFAEVLVSRTEDCVHGLVVLLHCQDGSVNICGGVCIGNRCHPKLHKSL